MTFSNSIKLIGIILMQIKKFGTKKKRKTIKLMLHSDPNN